MRNTTMALTANDIKAIKVALKFALEFAPKDAQAHMKMLLQRFENIVIPSRTKH